MTTLTTTTAPARVASWIRWTMAVLAVPQLVTGLWAVLDPQNFYDNFPGFGAMLVAAEPPFNQHLITDAGSGFTAVGVVLVLAAAWGERRPAQLALGGLLAFSVPHLWYHVANPAPTLTDSENLISALGLALTAAVPVVLLVLISRTRKDNR